MHSKYIFTNVKEKQQKYQRKLKLLKNININNIKNLEPIKSYKHKKKSIKIENTISQEDISGNDYEFICEYIEFLVLEPDKKNTL